METGPYVLWIAIYVGTGLTMTHQRFDSKDACEQAASDVRNMPIIRHRLEQAAKGNSVFILDHVCSGGVSKRQGAE